MTETAERTLTEILDDLDSAYGEWKGGEKDKNKYKDEFFKLAVEALKDETQAEKVVEIRASNTVQAGEIIGQRYPTWELDDIRKHPDREGYFEAIIRENPYYQSFSIDHNGKTYQRQVISGSAMLDDERLQRDDPELWKKVSDFEHRATLENIIYECGIDGQEVAEKLDNLGEAYGLPRQLKPLEDLDPEVLAQLQEYMYEGKPTIKFPAPKKVKEDG